MDPELLKALANMTPEQLLEALNSGQLVGTSGVQPVPPGVSATPGSPWQPGVGLKITEGQPIKLSDIQEGAGFGDAKTAIRPSVSGAGAAPPVRMQPPPSSSSSLSAVRPKPWGIEDLISADRPPPPLRSLPIPELPGEPLPTPRGAAGPPAGPAGGSAPGSSLRASALVAEPSRLPQPAPIAPAPPVAAAGALARPAPMPAAPPAPVVPGSMPQLPGMSGISQVEGAFGAGRSAQADALRQLLNMRGGQPGLGGAASGGGVGFSAGSSPGSAVSISAPAPIAAAGAPVRPTVPASAAPAAPSSMPRLPGMEGISQVDGAFGAGQSGQAEAFRQYLAGKGGQPGLAGAASGAGMGSPVPPPVGSVPGTGAGMPPPPPPGAGASPGAGIPGGQRLSQADEAMLRMRAAAADSKQFATKPVNPLASGAKNIGGKLLRGAGALGMGYTGYKVLEGAADAYDPNAGLIDNAGNMIGGGARAAWELRPTPMNMAFGGGTADMNDPNFKVGGIVGAGMAIKDYLDQRGQPEPFTEAQPGTSATIRAALDSGQSGQSRGAPTFDMGNPKPADPGATPPAPAVRPATPGGGPRKRPAAPAIPPSPETGVSGGSPGAGPGPYKLLGQDLQLPDTGSGVSAVRPGGAGGVSSSPSPTGSWRDKGYTALLNDKRGVMGEGRRMPLGAGPGEGARYGLDTEMKGNLAGSVRPSTGLNLRNAVPEYLEPEGEVPETEEDKQARLAAAKAKVSPIFAGLAPYSR